MPRLGRLLQEGWWYTSRKLEYWPNTTRSLQIWGKCIGCPKWKSCCTRIPDPTCVAANVACQAVRKTAYAALSAAKLVVSAASHSLHVANAALRAAQAIVNSNRWPLEAATGVLEGIKATVKAGATAASAITRLGLGGLIDIRKLEFNVQIALVGSGQFKGTIYARLLGGSVQRMFLTFRLKNVPKMASDLAEKVFPGITSVARKRRSVVNDIEPDSMYSQFGKSSIQKVEGHSVSQRHVSSGDDSDDDSDDDSGLDALVLVVSTDPPYGNNGGTPKPSTLTDADKVTDQLIHVGDSNPYLPSSTPVETVNEVPNANQEFSPEELDEAPCNS